MKTVSYFTYTAPGRIGIMAGTPRHVPAGYRMYRALVPRRDMLELSEPEYRAIYFGDILGRLDPQMVKADLERLAGSNEPVLLCFERPPLTPANWCHRRMAAEWFEARLGIAVPEIGTLASNITRATPHAKKGGPKAARRI